MSVFAAGLIAVTGLAAAVPAAAQDRVVVRERTVEPRMAERHVVVRERTTVRRGYGYGNRDVYRGRYGRGRQRVCTVRFRHGERIRTCRVNRY